MSLSRPIDAWEETRLSNRGSQVSLSNLARDTAVEEVELIQPAYTQSTAHGFRYEANWRLAVQLAVRPRPNALERHDR
jgi:hypothetical protein